MGLITNNEAKYNYWIYILTCLLVTAVPAYEMSRDSMTGERDVFNIILQIVLTFIFSSLAWIVGKRFYLNYIWTCTLGVAGNILLKLLWGISNFSEYDLDDIGFLIFAFIAGTLIFTFLILFVSFPIQLLINKIEKKLH